MLTHQKSSAKKLKGVIKQFYLLSTSDVLNKNYNAPITNCMDHNQSRLWKLYIQQMNLARKNVMLILDHGGSLSKHQFSIVKAVGMFVMFFISIHINYFYTISS